MSMNTRGVSEAMVALAALEEIVRDEYSGTSMIDENLTHITTLRAALEAALSAPEPAAQGECVAEVVTHGSLQYGKLSRDGISDGTKLYTAPPAQPAELGEEGFDVRKYVRHMADVLEAGGDLFKVDADLLRLAAAINKAANTAPPAQPAERVPEGWRVLQIGAVGSAYDPPNTRRAFTYDQQPGNGGAWALGKASSSAAKASAGDYIDGGLSLLKALQEQGFGVFEIDPSAASPAPGGKGVEG